MRQRDSETVTEREGGREREKTFKFLLYFDFLQIYRHNFKFYISGHLQRKSFGEKNTFGEKNAYVKRVKLYMNFILSKEMNNFFSLK